MVCVLSHSVQSSRRTVQTIYLSAVVVNVCEIELLSPLGSMGEGKTRSFKRKELIVNVSEQIAANGWNRFVHLFAKRLRGGLDLGKLVVDGRLTKLSYFLPQQKRSEHLVV